MEILQAKTLIQDTLTKPFDEKNYRRLVINLLNHIDETKSLSAQGSYIKDAYKEHIRQYKRLATYTDPDGYKLDVLIVYMSKNNSLQRARTMQRNFTTDYLKSRDRKDAALVAYVGEDPSDWRFSYVRVDYKTELTDSGRVLIHEEITPSRRYSFLVGMNEPNYTAKQQLYPLLCIDDLDPSLDEIESAFNIESISTEFFERYKELFLNVKEEIDNLAQMNPEVNQELTRCGINTAAFSKKLLGQVVFLYFLQKKGWLGVPLGKNWGSGSKNFLQDLFKRKYAPYSSFFNEILEPLFYEALAIKRENDLYPKLNCSIPFLNGGLFEPAGNYDWKKSLIHIKDETFEKIFDTFNLYNFTVREDEPLEREVAVDPEMLGKVFENLLEVKDRKSKGTYYTPRDIVHYMCQEALINYLDITINQSEQPLINERFQQIDIFGEAKPNQSCLLIDSYDPIVKREDIEFLIKKGDLAIEYDNAKVKGTDSYAWKLPQSIRDHSEVIDNALVNLKICDPAIGSGAFTVGIMSEIVKARSVLTTYLPKDPKRIPYAFKRHAIENSIYGVDIDASAVDIARLRLWLSLVVEEDDFNTIHPLPNLDYKIVEGNSLLGLEKNLLNENEYSNLKILLDEFIETSDLEKKKNVKREIESLISRASGNSRRFDFFIYFNDVFRLKGGFDVVIANPPYIGESGHKELFREVKKSILGKYYLGKMDYYYFFFHLAIDIGNKNSQIAFISTNYYRTAQGARNLRSDFKQRTVVTKLIDFNELKIFESAKGQHNIITFLSKQKNHPVEAKTCLTQRKGLGKSKVLKQILGWEDKLTEYYSVPQDNLYEGKDNYIRINGGENVNIDNSSHKNILRKFLQGEVVYLNNACNINQGVVSGCDQLSNRNIEKMPFDHADTYIGDGIFVFDLNNPRDLATLSTFNEVERKFLRNFYKNSDIQKYWSDQKPDKFLLYLDKEVKSLSNLPNINKHLDRFIPILKSRREVINGRIKYFQLQWPRSENIFFEPKIVVPYRSKENCFGYNSVEWFCRSDVYVLTQRDTRVDLKYVLALLNSHLFYYWFYHKGKRKGDVLELFETPLSETPIKNIEKGDQEKFIVLVDQIIDLKTKNQLSDVDDLITRINIMVYGLYGLSLSEINEAEIASTRKL